MFCGSIDTIASDAIYSALQSGPFVACKLPRLRAHSFAEIAAVMARRFEVIFSEGYVSGEVFPMIQNIDRFTAKATTPLISTDN